MGQNTSARRVPGLGQITWWIVMTKKMRGHLGKKIAQKSRNSCRVNGRGCACIGTVDSRRNFTQSYNQIQTLKECLCCHIYCAHHWPRLAAIVTASCAVSNRESRYPQCKIHGWKQNCWNLIYIFVTFGKIFWCMYTAGMQKRRILTVRTHYDLKLHW